MFDTGVELLEIFLFDFSGDLYGASLDVVVIAWIRPEFAFDTIDALVRRMEEDCRIARSSLARAGDAFPPLGEVASVGPTTDRVTDRNSPTALPFERPDLPLPRGWRAC